MNSYRVSSQSLLAPPAQPHPHILGTAGGDMLWMSSHSGVEEAEQTDGA